MTSKKPAPKRPVPRAPQPAELWEVVIVPFPFSAQPGSKRRPALVLSNRAFNQSGYSVLAMITTTGHHPWPGDVTVADLKAAGLSAPCLVRLKLFTLDNRLIVKKIGRLSGTDQQRVSRRLQSYLPW
ncbi:MAG: type II toxin-antitoxin system PemK/MazF family toxin [Chloracidobacterium sp.]|nr:type II toxin-antitoxin system PemK/MazF family toxin [Chloracidobacterium sp.]